MAVQLKILTGLCKATVTTFPTMPWQHEHKRSHLSLCDQSKGPSRHEHMACPLNAFHRVTAGQQCYIFATRVTPAKTAVLEHCCLDCKTCFETTGNETRVSETPLITERWGCKTHTQKKKCKYENAVEFLKTTLLF